MDLLNSLGIMRSHRSTKNMNIMNNLKVARIILLKLEIKVKERSITNGIGKYTLNNLQNQNTTQFTTRSAQQPSPYNNQDNSFNKIHCKPFSWSKSSQTSYTKFQETHYHKPPQNPSNNSKAFLKVPSMAKGKRNLLKLLLICLLMGSKGVRAVKGVKGVKKGKLIIKSLSSVIKGIIIFWNFLQKCERKLPQK